MKTTSSTYYLLILSIIYQQFFPKLHKKIIINFNWTFRMLIRNDLKISTQNLEWMKQLYKKMGKVHIPYIIPTKHAYKNTLIFTHQHTHTSLQWIFLFKIKIIHLHSKISLEHEKVDYLDKNYYLKKKNIIDGYFLFSN